MGDCRTAWLLLLVAPLLPAQGPTIGSIEIFGARKTPIEKIRQALGSVEGGPLPPSKTDAEERVANLPGVVQATLEAVCCEQGKAILYVGIEERGAPHFDFHTPPEGDLQAPEDLVRDWSEFLAAVSDAARAGNLKEDLSQGHSLISDPAVRQIQERFSDYANRQFELLRELLRKAANPQHRSIAAYVLGYAPKSKKRIVASDLQFALRDADPSVRNNAMRALTALAVLAERDPDLEIQISPTWFVEMLHATLFSDRHRAATALVDLTEKRPQRTLELLRERALDSLIEMARWRSLNHALPAFILLGRIAGLSEERIQALWTSGEREQLFRMLAAAKK